jgi:hypothetical protein
MVYPAGSARSSCNSRKSKLFFFGCNVQKIEVACAGGVGMKTEKALRSRRLREVLEHARKCAHDLKRHVRNRVLLALASYRNLTVPVGSRNGTTTVKGLNAARRRVEELGEEALILSAYLLEHLEAIHKSAQRKRHKAK